MLDGEGSSIHKIITEYFGRSNTSLMKHEANNFYISAIQPTGDDGGWPRVDTGSGTSLDLSWLAASRALRLCLGNSALEAIAASSRTLDTPNGLIRHGGMQ